jgi:hypothetical protein
MNAPYEISASNESRCQKRLWSFGAAEPKQATSESRRAKLAAPVLRQKRRPRLGARIGRRWRCAKIGGTGAVCQNGHPGLGARIETLQWCAKIGSPCAVPKQAAYIQVALDGVGQVLGSVMCIKCPPAARYCQHTCMKLDGSSHLWCARSKSLWNSS